MISRGSAWIPLRNDVVYADNFRAGFGFDSTAGSGSEGVERVAVGGYDGGEPVASESCLILARDLFGSARIPLINDFVKADSFGGSTSGKSELGSDMDDGCWYYFL